MMNIILLMYLAEICNKLECCSGLLGIIALIVFTISFCEGSINKIYGFLGAGLLLFSIMIPSKIVFYTYAAEQIGKTVIQSKEVNEIYTKTMELLNQKLDKELEKK